MADLMVSKTSQESLLTYVQKILTFHKASTDFRNKMDAIDVAYARYQQAKQANDKSGIDTYGNVSCGVIRKDVINPIVISNVQSMVAYWAEVFLSGYPRFPVVSTPDKKNQAEALEGILQDHMTLCQGDAELQVLFNDIAKYNLGACLVDWAPLSTYNPTINATSMDANTLSYDIKHINKVKRLSLRNVVFDPLVNPKDVAEHGEFIGHTEPYNRTRLKKLLNYLTTEKKLVHSTVVEKALSSGAASDIYIKDPVISNYGAPSSEAGVDWDQWGGFVPEVPEGMIRVPFNDQKVYYVTDMFVRIIPTDYLLNVPNKNSPQIWRLRVVNNQVLISAEKLNTALDMFPILLTHGLEDGMTLQTQSYAEMTIPIQDATTRLFNIRFQAANRAIQDRALYNPELIRSSDINSPIPTAKIPVKIQALSENGGFGNAYMNLPFDARGTEGVLQDAMIITEWQKDLTGQNAVNKGQFQKGNKTRAEFETVMGNSDNRGRLSGLVIAQRLFMPLKEQLKLNLLQFGEDTEVISPRSKKPVQMSVDELIQSNLQFEIADGYTPTSKMASTDMLMGMMNLIGTSPILQQVYGPQLPAMIAHMAQLGGIRGFDEYADAAVAEYQKQMTLQQNLMAMMQQLQQQLGAQPGAQPQQQPAQGQ